MRGIKEISTKINDNLKKGNYSKEKRKATTFSSFSLFNRKMKQSVPPKKRKIRSSVKKKNTTRKWKAAGAETRKQSDAKKWNQTGRVSLSTLSSWSRGWRRWRRRSAGFAAIKGNPRSNDHAVYTAPGALRRHAHPGQLFPSNDLRICLPLCSPDLDATCLWGTHSPLPVSLWILSGFLFLILYLFVCLFVYLSV